MRREGGCAAGEFEADAATALADSLTEGAGGASEDVEVPPPVEDDGGLPETGAGGELGGTLWVDTVTPGVDTVTLGTDAVTSGVDTVTPGTDAVTPGTDTVTPGIDTFA